MTKIDRAHEVVDLSNGDSIAGAVYADLDNQVVIVSRRSLDGQQEEATLHFPAGVRIVRRR